MKKFVVFMLSVFLLVCCAIGFMACTGGGNDSGDTDKPSTEQPNNPNDGDDESGGNKPVTPEEPKISVGAYIDGSLYQTVYTDENAEYKIETPVISDDITTNPNSERYFYGWFMDRNFQTPVTDDTVFKENSSIYGTWVDVYSNDFEYSVDRGEATITGFNNATATVVVVPSYLNSFPVTTIGSNAFKDKTMIRTLIICDGIETIQQDAFYNCNSMNKVVIPDSVTYLSGFTKCYSLTHIDIPKSVTNISYAFKDCTQLKNITIPNAISNISYAFQNCENLEDIKLPNSVIDITGAFQSCRKLEDIILPNSVIYIKEAFQSCSNLEKITLSNSVKDTTGAFQNCWKLKKISLPESVTYIGDYTFDNCINLTSVAMPNHAIAIGSYAFNQCSNLEYLFNSYKITSLGAYSFYKCVKVKNIVFSDNLESITTYAFAECSNLENLILPEHLDYLSDFAFQNCSSLTEINIPNEVSRIGMGAFSTCFAKKIFIPKSVSVIENGAFVNNDGAIIYAEVESKPSGWISTGPGTPWYGDHLDKVTIIWGYKGD